MKIKFDKDLFAALGLAAAGGLIITGVLALLAWISWGLIFIGATVVLIPIGQVLVEIWKENQCESVEDFIIDVIETVETKNQDDNDNRIC